MFNLETERSYNSTECPCCWLRAGIVDYKLTKCIHYWSIPVQSRLELMVKRWGDSLLAHFGQFIKGCILHNWYSLFEKWCWQKSIPFGPPCTHIPMIISRRTLQHFTQLKTPRLASLTWHYFTVLQWPHRPPDLNPLQHLWDTIMWEICFIAVQPVVQHLCHTIESIRTEISELV